MLSKKSFTLTEILVVVIIVGILAALGFPGYQRTRERVLDREARSVLSLLQAAEKIYRMEAGFYYPSAAVTNVIADINSFLRVDLPAGAASWSYQVAGTGSGDISTATRAATAGGRVWSLTHTGNTSTCAGTDCP